MLDALLEAGFDAVYDDPVYDVLEGIYDSSGKWANDLDELTFTGTRFHRSLRYAENHDEVRLASPKEWGGLGMAVGRPVSAVVYAMGRGPIMLYSGQEIGEAAEGAAGFGGDNARTSIFDYWSMPEFTKWVNAGNFDGGRLSPEQRELREWYGRLIRLMREPAFTRGEFYGLNHANKENPDFGRLDSKTVSGHWLYAFLRQDSESGQAFMVVVNFHGTQGHEGVRVRIPHHALGWLGMDATRKLAFRERLDEGWTTGMPTEELPFGGLPLPYLPALGVMMVEISVA